VARSRGGVIYIECHICRELDIEGIRAEDGSLICRRHSDRIWLLLERIQTMWRFLIDPEFLVGTVEPRSDMATKSRPPCNLDPIVIADPRSQVCHSGDLASAPRVLRAWCNAVSDSTGASATPSWDPLEQAQYLKVQLGWIQRQPAVVRFARHIGAVHSSLNRVVRYD
jgi:hypothetical protein